MKKWIRKFDEAMAAAAFAEAGEFETARETLREQRTILLALTGENRDDKAFRFAMHACQRNQAELEILYSSQKQKRIPDRIEAELRAEGIAYDVIKVEGCVREAVQKHTRRRSNILFVVVESSEQFNRSCSKSEKTFARSWKELKCPLVVVSEMAPA